MIMNHDLKRMSLGMTVRIISALSRFEIGASLNTRQKCYHLNQFSWQNAHFLGKNFKITLPINVL